MGLRANESSKSDRPLIDRESIRVAGGEKMINKLHRAAGRVSLNRDAKKDRFSTPHPRRNIYTDVKGPLK